MLPWQQEQLWSRASGTNRLLTKGAVSAVSCPCSSTSQDVKLWDRMETALLRRRKHSYPRPQPRAARLDDLSRSGIPDFHVEEKMDSTKREDLKISQSTHH